MGNFVVKIDEASKVGITLSEDKEFTSYTPSLLANPVKDAHDITYSWIKREQIKTADGNYTDPDGYRYLAYTFYLINIGKEVIDVSYSISISSLQGNIDSMIRFMIIEDDIKETIYQKADDTPKPGGYVGPLANATEFLSDIRVCEETVINFSPEEFKKYTIIMWLEGEDPDCTDENFFKSQIRLQMVFKIILNDE